MFDVFSLNSSSEDEKSSMWLKLIDEDIAAIEAVDFKCHHNKQVVVHAANHFSHLARGSHDEILKTCEENQDYALHILRRFLLSASAKDCSLMLTFKRVYSPSSLVEKHASSSSEAAYSEGFVKILVQDNDDNKKEEVYQYRIGVVDVDPKPVSKIPYYFNLDSDIVNHYKKKAIAKK